jgi:hypothetical protein
MPRGEALLKKKTTYGLSPRQLIRLLAIGRKGGDAPIGASVSKTPAEILGGILSSTLPLDPDSPNSLPVVLDWTGRKVLSASGRKIGDLLAEPKTDLEVLRGLKEYGKTLASGTSAKAKQAASTAIYYAAIASALVFHNRRITQLSKEKLRAAYSKLQEKASDFPEIQNLFRKALALCEQEPKSRR